MDILHYVAAGILCIVLQSSASRDFSVCKDVSYSYGPLPPVLPKSYILKYEWVDLMRNQTGWMEEYFDRKNLRAKLTGLLRGITFTSIYDYHSETVTTFGSDSPVASVRWDPASEDSCETTEMSLYDTRQLPFGYRYAKERPLGSRMDDIYEEFKFGGPYRSQFVKSYTGEETRGISTNVFLSCAYNKEDDSTNRMKYYWTAANNSFTFPCGEKEVPVRIEQFGTYPASEDDDGRIHWLKNVAWYETNPKFTDDIFQTPRSMYCKHSAKKRDMPELPLWFSFRVEQVSFTLDDAGSMVGGPISVSFKEIWYDSAKNLARVDMLPSKEEKDWPYVRDAPDTTGPLSIVLDFNYGAAFVTHASNGECVVKKLDRDFFLCNSSSSSPVKMVDPSVLFGVTKEHQYKGKYSVRDIAVDTWAAMKESPETAETRNQMITHEISCLSNDRALRYGEPANAFIPIQESLYTDIYDTKPDEVQAKFRQKVLVKNYFKYSDSQPRLSVFDAPGCIQHHGSRTFILNFPGAAKDLITENRYAFVDALRSSVRDYGDVGTVLRVQQVHVGYDRRIGVIRSFFTILAPLPELEQKVIRSIDDIKASIEEKVKDGTFFVAFVVVKPDGTKQPQSFKALDNSFIEYASHTSKKRRYYQPRGLPSDIAEGRALPVRQKYEETLGYSPGVFAAIVVAFLAGGIVFGIFAMKYYLMKRQAVQPDENPMELS
ncbi:unnamed protein product [Ixodes pacificus]